MVGPRLFCSNLYSC